MLSQYRHWHYKNTALLVVSLALSIFLAHNQAVQAVIQHLGQLGYIGALAAGAFFVSIFTVVPASVVLTSFTKTLDPLYVATLAGLGAVVGDYLIFRFLKDRVFAELRPLFRHIGGFYLSGLFHTPYFAWSLPIIGAIIIVSPLPDEMGLSLLGLSGIKIWQFCLLAFALNTVGIYFILTFTRFITA